MNTFWQGRPRTKLGKILQRHDIPQVELLKWTKMQISQSMLSRMCAEKDYYPTTYNVNIILKALKKHVDPYITYEDIWM